MDDMDQGLGDEVAHVDGDEGGYLQYNETENFTKRESYNMLETREMAIPQGNSPNSSFQILTDMLEGKNMHRSLRPMNELEHPCTSTHNEDDAGVMVEELTVQKHNSSNLAVVGTSNNRERMQTKHNRWKHLYQLGTGSGSGSSHGDRDHDLTMPSGWGDMAGSSFNEFLAQKLPNDDHNVVKEQSTDAENNGVSSNMLSHGSIRTKIISKSGFPEFFVKTTLKGKGIICRGPTRRAFKEPRDLNDTQEPIGITMPSDASLKTATALMVASNASPMAVDGPVVASNSSLSLGAKNGVPLSYRIGGPRDSNDTREAIGTTMPSNASLKNAAANMVASNASPKAAAAAANMVASYASPMAAAAHTVASNASLMAVDGHAVASNVSLSLGAQNDVPTSCRIGGPSPASSDHGVNLREWLKARRHKVNKIESLHIFRQIVELVDYSHSQEVTLLDLWPSSFKLLQSNHVKYLGSTSQREALEGLSDQDIPHSGNYLIRRRPAVQEMFPSGAICAKKQKFNNNLSFVKQWPLIPARSGIKVETVNESDTNVASTKFYRNGTNEHHSSIGYGTWSKSSSPLVSYTAQQPSTSISEQLEEKWYASPEELSEGICTVSSNIYSLGVLFFELLGRFDSERAHAAAMSDLRHRILPPNFLSENPKEAGFCLWLLHPEHSSRPTTRAILQSEVLNGLQEVCAEELSALIEQDDTESELLLHFLISLEEQKQKRASKLVEDIKCLELDIEEVERRHGLGKPLVHSSLCNSSINAKDNRHLNKQPSSSDACLSPVPGANELRLMRNISQLERAYFSMRSKIPLSDADASTRPDKDLLRNRENRDLAQNDEKIQNPTDCLGAFYDGLCKYARYSKFEVRGVLRTGDFNNSANVICSLSFDRDEDHFAAAGVSKKIKIFDFNGLFDDSVDIHYPAVEMSNRSRLSCICWNNYIKNYLASADYDGIVKIWDASTGQTVSNYIEHDRRAWSVDFSHVHPTKLASGSDDFSVKLWSINENNCLGSIRNIANVCCVQFSSHSPHLLAFGSADYRTYCYDLRNTKAPWCVLTGHDKAVSYVKFLDSATLVTASTDNTLKLWDLNKTSHSGPSTDACSLTFSGHTNEKNFVGLSTANDYITCGSETNEVYAYQKSLPMPITSYKFGSIDPISGKETDDDNGLFVSSVCWRQKSDMVVAASSNGCIKVLQMV